jgi:hypothetical protein
MRRHHQILTLSLALGIAGCVSAQATMLTPNRYAPVPSREVQVYLGVEEVPAECERIALIHAAGNANWTNEQQMISAARKKAGKAGANAVLIRTLRDPGLGTLVAAELFDLPADRKGELIGYRCPDLLESKE